MYHCHLHFYLTGCQSDVFETIKEMSPLEHFTHEFSESESPKTADMALADVVFADLRGMDAGEWLRELLAGKPEKAELILIADRGQMGLLEDSLFQVKDIWVMPMTEQEIRFRIFRWQQGCKMSKDFWQASHYLDTVIDNTPNLIWYKDKDGVHEKVNDSFCRIVNKTRKQVEGQRHAYIWDVEEDDPACIESEREVMSKRETVVSEEIIQTGEGKKILMTYKSPLYDLDGSVMGTVGVAVDATQERAYEKEILQKNRSLETILTSLDCGVVRHSLDGKKVLSINRAALELLGYETEEELQKDGFDMIAASVMDEDKEKLRKCIRKLQREGDIVSVEYRVQHKNGTILHIMGNVKLLREGGELVYQRFLVDNTAQKEQERNREKQYARLIKALSIDYALACFFELGTGKGVMLRNAEGSQGALASVFGGEIFFQECMENYIQRFVHEDDREMLRNFCSLERFNEELAEKEVQYVNYRAVADGRKVYFQVKVVHIGDRDGNSGFVLGLRSVDDEIRQEMEKKALLEDALLQANKASKAKSTFLSNMSHDIRTPMNAIVGFTSLAMSHLDRKDQVEEYLKKIMSSGNHLLSLINDVLDMSRIESGKIHLEETVCSLPEILHGLRNILQAEVRAKQLELYMDTMDVRHEEIYCDRLRLNQVLLNLLGNAVKYTASGGTVSMRIQEKCGAPDGYGSYEFYIRDTGIGMSREFVDHIFEPFEREKSTTISGIPGTGLGMAITKNIVDMMQGSIRVKSEQGTGTEFRVSFTFRLENEEKQVFDIPELRNCRALVVDDDFNTCDSVSYMLGQIGMRAEWTLSGKEAVLRTRQASMRGDNYSVYIIDWLLPDMNGVEVARRVRKETGGSAPIIVLTAYDWSDIEEEAREAGITAFCSKPLFLSELRSCLHSVINSDGAAEQAGTLSAQIRTGRILLAEDNELNQEIAVEILGEAGFTLDVAENGQKAVDMLKNSEPGYYQLILMDVQMPVMNGYEATQKIRDLKNPVLASIPIIAMTANAFEEDRREALSCGMNGHIAKPIHVETLLETLDHILN